MRTLARRLRSEPAASLAALSVFGLGLAFASSAQAQEVVAPRSGAEVDLALEVKLNGAARNLVSSFRATADGKVVGATAAEFAEIGFNPLKLHPGPDGLVHLDSLPGLRFRYDEANQAIAFDAPPSLLSTTRLNARPGSLVYAEPTASTMGAVVNYTVVVTGGQNGGSASAALNGRVFGRFGVISSSAVAAVGSPVNSGVVRLETTWRYDQPDRLLSYEAGDVITRGPSWTRPLHMGALQLSRAFALRPDLTTSPIPVISGSAATPSTLDLYVNNVKQLSAKVPAGPFEIARAPLAYGAGLAEVVVRDALGRDTRIELPFYASESLLARGLVDYAAAVGYARRNIGLLSNDYDRRLLISGSFRMGLNQRLTVEGHSEAGGGLLNAGAGAVLGLGRWAVANGAIVGSRNNGRMGALVDAGFESSHRLFTLSLHVQRALGGYQDLASVTAARSTFAVGPLSSPAIGFSETLYTAASQVPRAVDRAIASVPLWSDHTRLSVNYIREVWTEDRVRLAGVYLSRNIGRGSLYLRGSHDFDHSRSTTASFGLTMPFGGRGYTSSQITSNAGRLEGTAEAGSHGGDAPGELGWRVRVAEGVVSDRLADASYITQLGRVEAGVEQVNGKASVRGQFDGGLAYVAGQPFLSRRLDGPFAVVETGAKDLPVRLENRLVGTTGSSGRLLIPNLLAYHENRISVDPTDLPPDQDLALDASVVVPRIGAAALVNLRLTQSASALVALVDEAGQPLAAGGSVKLDRSGADFFVGYDGEAYLSGLGASNAVLVTKLDGTSCRATFDYRPTAGRQVRLGPVTCRALAASHPVPEATPNKVAWR